MFINSITIYCFYQTLKKNSGKGLFFCKSNLALFTLFFFLKLCDFRGSLSFYQLDVSITKRFVFLLLLK